MICKISDLVTEIPETGGVAPRCRDYLWEKDGPVDITIRQENYKVHNYPEGASAEVVAYLESGWEFYTALLEHDGMLLHSSALEVDGKAYLFSGDSGAGKSTHTRLWQSTFGEKVRIFNDDKPALRCIDGVWYAYGTPWAGKDGININMKVPLAGICFMKQAPENKIRRLTAREASQNILKQTMRYFTKPEKLSVMIGLLNRLVRDIPVFELENRPEPDAARLSYNTMRQAAEEMGL